MPSPAGSPVLHRRVPSQTIVPAAAAAARIDLEPRIRRDLETALLRANRGKAPGESDEDFLKNLRHEFGHAIASVRWAPTAAQARPLLEQIGKELDNLRLDRPALAAMVDDIQAQLRFSAVEMGLGDLDAAPSAVGNVEEPGGPSGEGKRAST